MSNEKYPGCLGCIGGYTTLGCRESLLNNQDSMESNDRFFFRRSNGMIPQEHAWMTQEVSINSKWVSKRDVNGL